MELRLREEPSFARKWNWTWNRWVVPDSLWSHGPLPTGLLHPWDSPGRSTGVGCRFLLQGIFLTQAEIEPRSPTLQADALLSETSGKPAPHLLDGRLNRPQASWFNHEATAKGEEHGQTSTTRSWSLRERKAWGGLPKECPAGAACRGPKAGLQTWPSDAPTAPWEKGVHFLCSPQGFLTSFLPACRGDASSQDYGGAANQAYSWQLVKEILNVTRQMCVLRHP